MEETIEKTEVRTFRLQHARSCRPYDVALQCTNTIRHLLCQKALPAYRTDGEDYSYICRAIIGGSRNVLIMT
jgi:hypothetical protein